MKHSSPSGFVEGFLKGTVAAFLAIVSTGSIAALPVIDDDISGDSPLNASEIINGNFNFDPLILVDQPLAAAYLTFTFTDDKDDQADTYDIVAFHTTDTQTANGVRTSNSIIEYKNYLDDIEREAVLISALGSSVTGEAEVGSYSLYMGATSDGPFPVPKSQCNNTEGFYSSCQNINTIDTTNFYKGKTGTFSRTIAITDAATLSSFSTSGMISFQITGQEGDLAFNNAQLKFELQQPAVATVQKYFPIQINGLSDIKGLNDNGEVVGQYAGTTSDGYPHAGHWRYGETTDLGLAGCRDTVTQCWSLAWDINNAGKISGESHLSESWPSKYFWPWAMAYPHDMLWENKDAAPVPMGTIGHEYTHAIDINEPGNVAGWGRSMDWNNFSGDRLVHGYAWRGDGDVYEIGYNGQYSKAFALNDAFQVTGEIDIAGNNQAYLWDDEQIDLLGHLGGNSGVGNDVSNGAEPVVVGASTLSDGSSHAFKSQYGVMQDLGVLPGELGSSAKAVNDAGMIVGSSGSRAVIWQNDAISDLNTLVDAGLEVQLNNAIDVSESGHVLATADDGSFYLLVPQYSDDPTGISVCEQGCDHPTLQAAINAAAAGESIYVAHGVYNEAITLDNGKSLISLHGPETTVIDVTGLNSRAVTINNASLVGFTVRGGSSTAVGYNGGGVLAGDNALIKQNIIIGNSTLGEGGGLFVSGNNVLIEENTISSNSALNGGGIAFSTGAEGEVINNNITANSATLGGGFYAATQGQHNINGNTIKGNNATEGAGVYLTSGALLTTLSNTVISHNHATGSGGGLVVYGEIANIANITVVDNSADVSAGGILASGVTLSNIISWNNTSPAPVDQAVLAYSISNGQSPSGTTIDSDPLFIDYANGDYRLQADSPAIDMGMMSGLSADLLSISRPYDGDAQGAVTGDSSDYDMGAYEYTPQSAVPHGTVERLSLGDDRQVKEGTLVNLGITRGNVGVASYQWSQVDGQAVTMSGNDTATASFTAPVLSTVNILGFVLQVNYLDGSQQSDRIDVVVAPINVAPVATSINDFYTRSGQATDLTGSATDADGSIADFSWSQVSGETVTLMAADGPYGVTFTAPITEVTLTLVFQLTVTDNEGSVRYSQVTVTVYPLNLPPTVQPIALATPQDVAVSSLLDGSDFDGDSLSYQVAANPTLGSVVITDPATGTFTYTPNAGVVGVDSFSYVANDGTVSSDPSAVSIQVGDQGLQQVGVDRIFAYQDIWTLAGEADDRIVAVHPDSRGNRIVVGNSQGGAAEVDLDVTSSGVDDHLLQEMGGYAVVSRINADGDHSWGKVLGNMYILSSAVDSVGSTYVAGFFSGTYDFDPGPGVAEFTASNQDSIIVKLDAAGNYVNAWQWGTATEHTNIDNIAVDGSDNLYIAGRFNTTLDIDPSSAVVNITSDANLNTFLVKMDADGNYLWGKQVAGNDIRVRIAIGQDGAIYRTGNFGGTLDFDPSSGIDEHTGNIYVSKLSTDGDYLWSRAFLGGMSTYSGNIALEGNDALYLTGSFRWDMDLDPGVGIIQVSTDGASDSFIAKFTQDGSFQWSRQLNRQNIKSIAADGTGNLFVGGSFGGTVDFDWSGREDIKNSLNWEDFFYTRLSSDGEYFWTYTGGGNSDWTPIDVVEHISIDHFGKLYVSGSFGSGSVDFDPGPAVVNRGQRGGKKDGFTAMLSPTAEGVDTDGDGFLDHRDAFPNDSAEWHDHDGDGIGNNVDSDDDGDGLSDSYELSVGLNPTHSNVNYDSDGDGWLDLTEFVEETHPLIADTDGDGVVDSIDAFPSDPTETLDTDGDGLGNNEDLDDDWDYMPDTWELTYGLDPLNKDDALDDANENGVSNLDEFLNGNDPLAEMPTYMTISWVDQVNTEVVDDVLKQVGGYVWGGAISLNGFVGDGGVEYQATGTEYNRRAFGLTESNDSTDKNDMEYAFYISQTYTYYAPKLYIYESGSSILSLGSYVYGEQLSIYRKDDTIYYERNGEIVHTSTRTSTVPLIADTSLYIGSQFSGMQLFALEFVTDDDGDGAYGAFDLYPNDPTEWSDFDGDGIPGNADLDDDNDGMPDLWEIKYGFDPYYDHSNAPELGLDIDGDGYNTLQEAQRGYDPYLAYRTLQDVDWIESTYVKLEDTRLYKTISSSGTSSATSQTTIEGDGGVEYVTEGGTVSHSIGITTSSGDEYSFYTYRLNRPTRYVTRLSETVGGVYAHQSWLAGNSAGVMLRVYREAGTIYYEYNGTIVRSVAELTGEDLVAEAGLHSSYASITGVKMFGGFPSGDGLNVTKTEDTNDGVCDSDCSLREAVIAANTTPGEDVINLPAGEYLLTLDGIDEDGSASGDLDVKEDLIINGAGVVTTTIDGNEAYRLFDVNQGVGEPISLTLRDLTLRNGRDESPHAGSGIAFYSDGVLTIENALLTKHWSAGYGAAIQLRSIMPPARPTLQLSNSVITENCALSGAAIDGEGEWTVENSTLSYNGGTFTDRAGSTTGCNVIYGGAAIYIQYADVTIRNSTLNNNIASGDGGAIHVNAGSLTIVNSTLSNNQATSSWTSGGAISLWGGDLTLQNSTVVNNHAHGGQGGGIRFGGFQSTTATMVNSIVANNTASQCADVTGTISSLGHNLVEDWGVNDNNGDGCGFLNSASDLELDPALGSAIDPGTPGGLYYPPVDQNSPVVDAGDNLQCETTDQLGTTRPQDGNNDGNAVCDIGAYEY